jgi:hypothetical protein
MSRVKQKKNGWRTGSFGSPWEHPDTEALELEMMYARAYDPPVGVRADPHLRGPVRRWWSQVVRSEGHDHPGGNRGSRDLFPGNQGQLIQWKNTAVTAQE